MGNDLFFDRMSITQSHLNEYFRYLNYTGKQNIKSVTPYDTPRNISGYSRSYNIIHAQIPITSQFLKKILLLWPINFLVNYKP